jgi:hypothetical protein
VYTSYLTKTQISPSHHDNYLYHNSHTHAMNTENSKPPPTPYYSYNKNYTPQTNLPISTFTLRFLFLQQQYILPPHLIGLGDLLQTLMQTNLQRNNRTRISMLIELLKLPILHPHPPMLQNLLNPIIPQSFFNLSLYHLTIYTFTKLIKSFPS